MGSAPCIVVCAGRIDPQNAAAQRVPRTGFRSVASPARSRATKVNFLSASTVKSTASSLRTFATVSFAAAPGPDAGSGCAAVVGVGGALLAVGLAARTADGFGTAAAPACSFAGGCAGDGGRYCGGCSR